MRKTPELMELYLQLFEIQNQLLYLQQHGLAKRVEERMDQLWSLFDDGERKELAIAIQNIGA